jgi:glycosyltransferase involved in cell wall biosynthesis
MEPRKGVATIMRAANALVKRRPSDDWHVLLLGNKSDEAQYLIDLLDPDTTKHVTFGGYRTDIEILHRSCYAGIIASTGWDSLTCSSLEMQSSGLPLLLSDLLGLREAIEDGVSGLLFPPGDHETLANRMSTLLDEPALQQTLSEGARRRAESKFSEAIQLEKLTSILRHAYASA